MKKPNLFRRTLTALTSLKGPMASGDKFITLDESYLERFDEVVVIGDIHGCCDEFEELLDKVHSESPSKDPRKCLKLLVGDLVNKGPKSKQVLQICRDFYPDSILAVRGNHDEIVLERHKQSKAPTKEPLEAKNKWIETLPNRYITYLNLLPYTISIPSLNSIIVHAGLEPSIESPATKTQLDLMTHMRSIIVMIDPKTKDHYYKCTKSSREGAPWATFWPGPEFVYFGHDARRRLQDTYEYALGLDTGCVYGDKLSYVYIKGPRKGEICSIKAKQIYKPVEDDSPPPEAITKSAAAAINQTNTARSTTPSNHK